MFHSWSFTYLQPITTTVAWAIRFAVIPIKAFFAAKNPVGKTSAFRRTIRSGIPENATAVPSANGTRTWLLSVETYLQELAQSLYVFSLRSIQSRRTKMQWAGAPGREPILAVEATPTGKVTAYYNTTATSGFLIYWPGGSEGRENSVPQLERSNSCSSLHNSPGELMSLLIHLTLLA